MSYQCEVIDMSAAPTRAIRTETTFHKLPKTIRDGFSTVRTYLKDHALTPTGPIYVKYDGPPAHDFFVEVGVPVTADAPDSASLQASSLIGGRAASCIHRGHYTDLPHAYKALERWVAAEGLVTTGAAYELYLNDGEHTQPDAWLTRISLPLV